MNDMTKSAKKDENEPGVKPVVTTIELPAGSQYIIIYKTPDGLIFVDTGGFRSDDEALGFNRRLLQMNPTLTEQMILTKQMNKLANQQQIKDE